MFSDPVPKLLRRDKTGRKIIKFTQQRNTVPYKELQSWKLSESVSNALRLLAAVLLGISCSTS